MNTHPPDSPAVQPAGSTGSSIPGPPELRFLLPEERTNLKAVFGGGGASWLAFFVLVLLVASLRPDRQIQARLPDLLPKDIVWLEQPGPGGGGGGGGNKSPEPPKTDKLPAIKKPDPPPQPTPEPPKPEPVPEPEVIKPEIAAITPTESPVVVSSAPAVASTSLGTGDKGGAGTGSGGGEGPGRGRGVGDGFDDGIGNGAFRVGNGVLPPTVLFQPKPLYTSEAMLRRIQGETELDCVVLADGTVGKCDVVKSLDSNQYGLDNEALKAAKRFKFRPGTRQGQPVAVLVRIILEFNMR